jgi:AcrR family transcriptional regulator
LNPGRAPLSPEQIVETAAVIADHEGTDALTLARLAGELGVRAPSLYNHVDGLDDLRHRLTLRALDELGARIQRAAVGRQAHDAVRAIAHAFRRFAHERPGLYAATVPTTEVDDDAIRRLGAEIVATVVDALAGYELDEATAIHATRALRSAVHGFVSLEHSGGFGLDVDLDDSFSWLVELVASGIGHEA